MSSPFETSISRRSVMKGGLAAGIGMALGSPHALAAETASLPLITKTVPSSGEKLPVIGLGTNAYSVTAPEEIAARREVLQKFPQLGAKIIDTARGYGESEVVLGNLIKELGIRDKVFIATKTPMRSDLAQASKELELALTRMQVSRLDLFQVHNFFGIDEFMPLFQEWKKAGKVRYIGVSTSTDQQYPQLLDAMKKHPLDFIQVDYSIENRGSEAEILPLAQSKGMAVLINVPLGGRRGNLLPRVADKKLPDWAADMDATSWAQVLLKYNVSHPAVTAVIPGTTKLTHLEDNQRAGRGRLPDAALRKKIEEFWATLG
jgi:aryl-alcohol dehydrogenase-like predicted oxidoreductase